MLTCLTCTDVIVVLQSRSYVVRSSVYLSSLLKFCVWYTLTIITAAAIYITLEEKRVGHTIMCSRLRNSPYTDRTLRNDTQEPDRNITLAIKPNAKMTYCDNGL